MTDERSRDPDLEWYESRWEELMEVLSVSDPEAVMEEVRHLQERAETITQQHEALAEAGVEDPERLLQMLANMTDQLEELYAERDQRGEPRFERTMEVKEHSDDG
jgi:two-component sensor histidine kinase